MSYDVIVKGLDKERQKLLISRGVSGQDLIPSKMKIDFSDYFVNMETSIPGATTKAISAVRQAKKFCALMEHPLKGSYTLGISSYPSDLRAKYLAQTIMSAAVDHYMANRRKFGVRSLPLWHTVYGSFKDKLRDFPRAENPCMLIISNLHDEASSIKIEKTRDLLEQYGEIPRIVVSGGQPTCDLFAYRLAYQLEVGVYIGPPNLVKEKT